MSQEVLSPTVGAKFITRQKNVGLIIHRFMVVRRAGLYAGRPVRSVFELTLARLCTKYLHRSTPCIQIGRFSTPIPSQMLKVALEVTDVGETW